MVNLKTAIRSSNSRNVSSLSLNVATRVDTVWPSVSNRYSKWWLSPLLVELVSRSVSLKMVYSCFSVSVVALDTGLCVCGGVGGCMATSTTEQLSEITWHHYLMCCKQTREAHKWWNSSSKQPPISINLSAAISCLNLHSPESRHFFNAATMAYSAGTVLRLVVVPFFSDFEDNCSSRLITKHWVLEQLVSLEMFWGSKCKQRSQRKVRMAASLSSLCIADSQYCRHIGRISYQIRKLERLVTVSMTTMDFFVPPINLPLESWDNLLLLLERTLSQAPPPPPSHTHPPPPSQGGDGSLEWQGWSAPRRPPGVRPLTPHQEGGHTRRECPAEPMRDRDTKIHVVIKSLSKSWQPVTARDYHMTNTWPWSLSHDCHVTIKHITWLSYDHYRPSHHCCMTALTLVTLLPAATRLPPLQTTTVPTRCRVCASCRERVSELSSSSLVLQLEWSAVRCACEEDYKNM